MNQNSIKLTDIKVYLAQQGVNINENNAEEFINSCFEECDTKDEAGKDCDGGDKLLSGDEKDSFFIKLAAKFEKIAKSLAELFKERNDSEGFTRKMYSIYNGDVRIKTKDSVGSPHNQKIYDKEGNLKSTKENYVETQYYTEGNNKGRIKSQDGAEYDYYENGQVKSKKQYGEETTYYPNGNKKSEEYMDDEKHQLIQKRYREDGSLGVITKYNIVSKGFLDLSYMSQRTIYKNDKIFSDTKYDDAGKITNYTKNLPEGKIDFDENLLNGKIDGDFSQGQSGVCYIATSVKSLLQSKNGIEILNKTIIYDSKNQKGTVKFAGLDKEYTFTKDEIMQAMTRLGTGDPDFTLLCLGYEKYREENKMIVDGGTGGEFLFALKGNYPNTNYDKTNRKTKSIDDEMMLNFQKAMESHQCFSAFGTLSELPETATQKGLHPNHEYFAKDFKNGKFVVSDAAFQQDIEISPEEFKEYFGNLAFDKL